MLVLLLGVGLVLAVVEPLLFAGCFAGDAQVHLVFAENAAHGRLFEFNPGQRVSGETSPGYMLLAALLFKLLPGTWIPGALKVLGGFAWYALGYLTYRAARRLFARGELGDDRLWPTMAGLASALVGGSVYNANVGMENGIFAAMIWAWIDRACAWRWFEETAPGPSARRWRRELCLASVLGLACWFRPEGLIVVAIAYGFRFRAVGRFKAWWVVGAVIAAGIGIAAFALEFAVTGDAIPISIVSRRLLAMQRAMHIGPLLVDPGVIERLLAYLPLSAYFVLDLYRRHGRTAVDHFLLLVFGTFFFGYTFVTGAAQLARYAIFLMPILAIGAARAARVEWSTGSSARRAATVVAALLFLGINLAESRYRIRRYSPHALAGAVKAPARRTKASDEMLERLGNPGKRPVVLALEPIQVRYELDDRFVIRSMDGRTDPSILQAAPLESIDYLTYLKTSDIDYVFLRADEVEGPRADATLRRLASLRPAESITDNDVRITKLSTGALAVTHTPTAGRGCSD